MSIKDYYKAKETKKASLHYQNLTIDDLYKIFLDTFSDYRKMQVENINLCLSFSYRGKEKDSEEE